MAKFTLRINKETDTLKARYRGGEHSAPFARTVLTRDSGDAFGRSATTGGLHFYSCILLSVYLSFSVSAKIFRPVGTFDSENRKKWGCRRQNISHLGRSPPVVAEKKEKKNQIGDHALPQRGFGLSTPSRAERKGATPSNPRHGRKRESR
jgi:hypothetical protein